MEDQEEPNLNFEPIFELVRYGQELAKQAVALYEPEVQRLIKSNCRMKMRLSVPWIIC